MKCWDLENPINQPTGSSPSPPLPLTDTSICQSEPPTMRLVGWRFGGRCMQRSQQSSKRSSRSVEDDKEGHLVCRIGDWLQERCTATFRKTLPLYFLSPLLDETSPARGASIARGALEGPPVIAWMTQTLATSVFKSVAVRKKPFMFLRIWMLWTYRSCQPSVLQVLMPYFFSLLDEIVGNLGEGTFGKVVECLDHAR